MEPEGMVHALKEIHHLLKPGGRLIDIHPFAEASLIEIHQGQAIIFSEPVPTTSLDDIQQADNALAAVIQQGLFAVERASEFDFRIYAPSVSQLRDFLAEASAFEADSLDEQVAAQREELAAQVEALMGAAGEGAEVATYERAHIARLAPL
jgi:hypothetical protein